ELPVADVGRVPAGERLDVLGADGGAVLVAEQVLEEQAQRVGQTRDGEALFLERFEAEEREFAAADPERRSCAEAVHGILSVDVCAQPAEGVAGTIPRRWRGVGCGGNPHVGWWRIM